MVRWVGVGGAQAAVARAVQISAATPYGGHRSRQPHRCGGLLFGSTRLGCGHPGEFGVEIVSQGLTDAVQGAQQTHDLSPGHVTQPRQSIEIRRRLSVALLEVLLGRVADLSSPQEGSAPDAFGLRLRGCHQLGSLLAGCDHLDGAALLRCGQGRLSLLPFPAAFLLVSGDLRMSLGQHRGGTPFRGLAHSQRFLLGRP
jgi:hypothetical protein